MFLTKKNIINIFRWFVVLPVFFIIIIPGGKIIETILLIQNSQGNWPVVIESIVGPVAYLSLAVYLSTITAPQKKNI